MKLISCSLTENQVRDGSKDVTRRLGWLDLKPGDQLMFCRKVMGRKKGEPIVKIRAIEIVSARREALSVLLVPSARDKYTPYALDEMRREGFPIMTPAAFVKFFCDSHGPKCTPNTVVTRLEFKYIATPGANERVHELPVAQIAE